MKITWYKKAKLFNASNNNEDAIAIVCDECKKWGTVNDNNKIEWKYYYEMSPEEQYEIDLLKRKFNNTGKTSFKTTTCPDCSHKPPSFVFK